MNERLRMIREALKDENGKKYTQAKFAEELNVSRDVIASYENGRVIPSDFFINYICSKYNIDENWLRTGEGEMFLKKTREMEIAEISIQMFKASDDDFRYQLYRLVASLSEDQTAMLKDMAVQLLKEDEKKKSSQD